MKCTPRIFLPHKISEKKKYSARNNSSYLDWYYCDPEATEFPIRDVTTMGKMEPDYKHGTFNLHASCNQRFLYSAIKKEDVSHIFFFTKYNGKNKLFRHRYFITGFFEIGKTCVVNQPGKPIRRGVLASNWKFFKISECLELSKVIGKEICNGRHAPKKLDSSKTEMILKHFAFKRDQTKNYVSLTDMLI